MTVINHLNLYYSKASVKKSKMEMQTFKCVGQYWLNLSLQSWYVWDWFKKKTKNNQLISRNAKKQAKAYKCDTRQENEA